MADVDDGSILDSAGMLRRIRPDQVVDDKSMGQPRPSSAAFKNHEMSVDCEPILQRHGLDWKFSLRNHPGYSLVRFSAGSTRALGLAVVHKPESDNPAHAEIIGKKTAGIANRLVAESQWVHLNK